jgi:Fur family ferric uptake transcriptional regulator
MEPATKERATRQKTAIRMAIDAARRPLTPLEVLQEAREQVPALSIATVYRNIKSLLQEGSIHMVPLPGDNPRYESTHAASTHHHHFQCLRCQRVFDVHDCPVDLQYVAPPGFSVERHELTFYGRCADCRVPDAGAPRKPARRGAAARAHDQKIGHGHR